MNNLTEYLKENGITQKDFAARLNVRQATVSRVSRGIAEPSLNLAAAIERETAGQVLAVSLLTATQGAQP